MVNINFNNKFVVGAFWTILIVVCLYIYLIVEPRHNSCWIDRDKQCGPDKFRVAPEDGDTEADLLRRLEGHTQLDQEKVFWRRSFLFGVVAAVLVLMLYHKKVPPPTQVIVATMIVFIALYFHNSYYAMHFDMRSHNYAKLTIDELRRRLNLLKPLSSDRWGTEW